MRNLESLKLYTFNKGQSFPNLENPPNLAISRCNLFQYRFIKQIWSFNRKKIWERIRRGDHCYLAYLNKKPVHFSWVQSQGIHYIKNIDLSVPVQPGSIVIFHCRTSESARGQNIYPLVLQQILGDYFQKAYQEAWIYTSANNVPSQKGIKKAGFTPVIDLEAFLETIQP